VVNAAEAAFCSTGSPIPPEFIVGAVRAIDAFDPLPRALLLAEWCTRSGQELIYPPSVLGWPGGRAWITTVTLLARSRFVGLLCEGRLNGRPDEPTLAPPFHWMRHHGVEDRGEACSRLAALLAGATRNRRAARRPA
jgi:uncharacterized protein DUF1800